MPVHPVPVACSLTGFKLSQLSDTVTSGHSFPLPYLILMSKFFLTLQLCDSFDAGGKCGAEEVLRRYEGSPAACVGSSARSRCLGALVRFNSLPVAADPAHQLCVRT